MNHPRGPSAALLAAATITLAGVSACGSSAPTDKEQIAAIVSQGGDHPATLCSHLTDPLLAHLGGKDGCLRAAASAAHDPTTHATSIRVHGHSATAVVVNRAGSRTISLVKEGGRWKVVSVG